MIRKLFKVHFIKSRYFLKVFSIITFSFFPYPVNSQVYEVSNSDSYENVARFAQKGLVDWKDLVFPMQRSDFGKEYFKLLQKKNVLSKIEEKEVKFYLADYYEGDSTERKGFFSKSKKERFYFYNLGSENFNLYCDPSIGAEFSHYNNSKYNFTYFNGLKIWGYIGKQKKIGFNLLFRDVTVEGDSLNNIQKDFTPSQGYINVSRNSSTLNYSDLSFNLAYTFKNGSVNIGKSNLNWGYGEFGKLVLSSKAPSFLNIRLQYNPTKWLKFDYFHGWLNSNVIDSNSSYLMNNRFREVYVDKFIASHTLSIYPTKGLSISIGESLIYSDKFNLAYLVPINFFKAYDQYISNYSLLGGANSQFFLQISSRNNILNTHAYASILIDEVRISKIFDKIDSRNQLGYCIGFSKTDFLFPYLTIGAEYTKIRGGVYSNIISSQSYSNSDFILGDWIGQNADRWGAFIKLTPFAKFKIKFSFLNFRKGMPLTIEQQYYLQPEPSFLNNYLFTQKMLSLNTSYEIINTLKINFNIDRNKFIYTSNLNTTVINTRLGITYGL